MFALEVFCVAAENVAGPVQLQPVTALPPPVKVSVAPAQTGFGLAVAVTPDTLGFTVTDTLFDLLPHPFTAVTDTV